MRVQHLRVIHRINVVAGQDQHVLRVRHFDEVQVLVNRVRRSAVPVGALGSRIRRQDEHAAAPAVKVPSVAVAEIIVQLKRAILRQDAHALNPRMCAVRQREIDDAVLSPKRHRWFRYLRRQHPETAALASGQDHGQAPRFHVPSPPIQFNICIRYIYCYNSPQIPIFLQQNIEFFGAFQNGVSIFKKFPE